MNVLFIDNFDAFTYNLVYEFEKRKCEMLIYRNNVDLKIIDNVVKTAKPKLIVIGPGPSTPRNAGNSLEIIGRYWQRIPVFGVSLGHQCIVEVFGGRIEKLFEVMYGKTSMIEHDNGTIFKEVEMPLKVARYHALAAADVPYALEISARSEKGIVMGVRHKEALVEGIQFNPESVLTPAGGKIIDNIIELCKKGR